MKKDTDREAKQILETVTNKIEKTNWYFNFHYYRLIEIINSILSKKTNNEKERALELGIWPGYLALSLEKIGFDVSGIDLDSSRIKKHFSPLKIKDYDLNNNPLKIPFPDNHFKWVIVSEVIEHINPNNLTNLFLEINRLLENNGFAIITTPNRNSLHNFIFRKKMQSNLKNGHGHLREYSHQELQNTIKKSSLKIIKINSTNFYSNVGSLTDNTYFYPLSNLWKYPNKFFNLLKICSLPVKNLSFFKDSIFILVQKND